MSETTDKKEKIAILGGGWGAVSTALFLTDPKNPKADQYDITLYQLGWRLGGKGASGRGEYGRIEEHGLHIWIGFYENSFMAIQEVYEEVQQYYKEIVPDYEQCPFKSWRDAFKPHDFIVLMENIEAQWKSWGIHFPTNDEIPGVNPSLYLTPWEYVKLIIGFMHSFYKSSKQAGRETARAEHEGVIERLTDQLKHLEVGIKTGLLSAGETILAAAAAIIDKAEHAGSADHHKGVLHAIEHFVEWLQHKLAEDLEGQLNQDDDIRRTAITLVLCGTCLIGMIKEGVLSGKEGLDALDEYDLREWLRKYDAPEWVVNSAPIQAMYDLVFGYENGEISKANFGAGAALRSMVRIGLTYKGSIFWKMQAGMGDTVFAPPYLVLKGRGVKFEYFNRVKNLGVDPDSMTINSIDIGVQATLKDGVDEYDPLVICRNLPSWPADPNYDQLEQGEELKERG
ncbi:MAG: NAD(P)-binding protein, partial [Verrucomicrobiota bacterium]